ncbi:Gfo/Idh/MocA family oxidoreductase [Sphingobium sufflavum]|uniref:Gfo/Idh/MocA family protein n=1 Tax=Sphingobium sufflavum TaxID=1129547 RepID=UPI001F1F6F20|nr:Gfo/Idh/MocA family oxidoreductase [Sphingobium sufflavum]MCE7796327.1 Gfo/Idh/MocA family oxidoreductase [Sphingobium sufflavum]
MSTPLTVGLVGYGKIAHDQHVPAIAANADVQLVAVASRNSRAEGVRNYSDIDAMLAAEPALDAVILCQPPQARYAAARAAILAGKHVFMEKPPGATVSEVEALVSLARAANVTLFASWHSRYASCVARARRWIAERDLTRIDIVWKEDVRHWHPGQAWIWEPGGFGVFDPGINALSILTGIVVDPIRLLSAELETPANRQAPIAARLAMATAHGIPITAEFDWRQTGPQSWDIVVEAGAELLCLGHGGNSLTIDGVTQAPEAESEYPALYAHFVSLVQAGESDVDLSPIRLVADAFLSGHNHTTELFED